MQSLLISDGNCRYEAVASSILKGFYFSYKRAGFTVCKLKHRVRGLT